MKTRLLLAFCLAWAFGCGNRAPGDVQTGVGDFRVATVLICNDSNCVGGSNAGAACVEDTDCPDGSCEMLTALRECSGGANNGGSCLADGDCGLACSGGSVDGDSCLSAADCGECLGGNLKADGDPCDTDVQCGGQCQGGTVPNGTACTNPISCGGAKCEGGTRDGFPCTTDLACQNFGGIRCKPQGSCNPVGVCQVVATCEPVSCEDVGTGCVGANPAADFQGLWDSCDTLDHYMSGTTFAATAGLTTGPPIRISVSGCDTATLDLAFTRNSSPVRGCAHVEFTAGDLPTQEACGAPLHMDLDLQ